jgi:hypothetical protein
MFTAWLDQQIGECIEVTENPTIVQLKGRQVVVDATPLAFGSATFCTKSLVQLGTDHLALRSSAGVWVFAGIFLALGLSGLVLVLAGYLEASSVAGAAVGILGLIFTLIGLSQVLFLRRYLFDRESDRFIIRWFMHEEARPLAAVLAVQIVERFGKTPRTRELNLVLDDATQPRLSLSNHTDIKTTYFQAARIAEFLGVPLLQNTTEPETTIIVNGRQIPVETAPVENTSGGQANFRTMVLVQQRPDCLVLRSSLGMRLVAGISFLAGTGAFALSFVALFGDQPSIFGFCFTAGMGLLFMAVGTWMFIQCGDQEFDLKSGQWTTRRFGRVQTRLLSDIIGVQVLYGGFQSSDHGQGYSTWQINLILDHSTERRYTLSDHADKKSSLSQAAQLARFLKVQLMEMTEESNG